MAALHAQTCDSKESIKLFSPAIFDPNQIAHTPRSGQPKAVLRSTATPVFACCKIQSNWCIGSGDVPQPNYHVIYRAFVVPHHSPGAAMVTVSSMIFAWSPSRTMMAV
jgi:hypothetical protein